MDDDSIVRALFLEAFGTIDHELLLKKMQLKFGVARKAEEWFWKNIAT